MSGSFRTLRDGEALKNVELNPRGLFNFKFEFGCGNNQYVVDGKVNQPTFATMVRELADDVDFAILNGDFIYEKDRDFDVEAWSKQVGINPGQTPRVVKLAPTITGAWQNYKTYLSRGHDLSEWLRASQDLSVSRPLNMRKSFSSFTMAWQAS